MKICVDCKISKGDDEFYSYELLKKSGRCKECFRQRSKNYINNNKDKKREADKKYREENKEKITEYYRGYAENNKEKITSNQANWYKNNQERLLKKAKNYRETHKEERNSNEKQRRENDPVYKLRTNISKLINQKLKNNSSAKENSSILEFLPYSFEDLKQHLEAQFEPWMNWENYGRYIKNNWNDNDQKTWRWQLDHIIPQSDLPYTNMKDTNFQKCWALENLRPLNAKINVLIGTALSKNKKIGVK